MQNVSAWPRLIQRYQTQPRFAHITKSVSSKQPIALFSKQNGAIPPLGLPASWPILIDARVAASDAVVIGSGIRASKLIVSGSFLAALPSVRVLENLGRVAA